MHYNKKNKFLAQNTVILTNYLQLCVEYSLDLSCATTGQQVKPLFQYRLYFITELHLDFTEDIIYQRHMSPTSVPVALLENSLQISLSLSKAKHCFQLMFF